MPDVHDTAAVHDTMKPGNCWLGGRLTSHLCHFNQCIDSSRLQFILLRCLIALIAKVMVTLQLERRQLDLLLVLLVINCLCFMVNNWIEKCKVCVRSKNREV